VLQDVGYSDTRLYDGFLEIRMHPSALLSARQIMAVIAECFKECTTPTDIMSIFQIAASHQRHSEMFSAVASMTL
jgi:hypothetical protein